MKVFEKKFVRDGNSMLSYIQVGDGPNVWITFHGFAQTKLEFAKLAGGLGNGHRIYSFDLFFHGDSLWLDGDMVLTPIRWKVFIEKFLAKENIQQFNIAAFSLGGKFALLTLSLFPDRVSKISLIAADGVKTTIWFKLARYRFIRDRLKGLVVNASLFYKAIKWVERMKIIDKQVTNFAKLQMEHRKRRRRLFYSWMVFREIKPEIPQIAKLINEHNIQLMVVLGQYDPLMTTKTMNPLWKRVHNRQMLIFPTGHYTLMREIDFPSVLQIFR